MSATIGPGSRVTLHFSLALEDGSVVDSNFGGTPAAFTMGDGSLLPGFEALLVGLGAGAAETFFVAPEQGFGLPNPTNTTTLPRHHFAADMALSEGLVVLFADAAGAELPGTITAIDSDHITVDFNHPLAGHTLDFTVHVLAVE